MMIDIPQIKMRAKEVARYCEKNIKKAHPSESLRTLSLNCELFLTDRTKRRDMFCRLQKQRLNLIPETEEGPLLDSGSLLAFFPDASLSDGAAEDISEGFFDRDNFPPQDTWIIYREGMPCKDSSYSNVIISFVPDTCVHWAQEGIDVNPEQCIMWLEDMDTFI